MKSLNDFDEDVVINGFVLIKAGTVCRVCKKSVNVCTAYRLSDIHVDCFWDEINKGKMNIMDFWSNPNTFHNRNKEKLGDF